MLVGPGCFVGRMVWNPLHLSCTGCYILGSEPACSRCLFGLEPTIELAQAWGDPFAIKMTRMVHAVSVQTKVIVTHILIHTGNNISIIVHASQQATTYVKKVIKHLRKQLPRLRKLSSHLDSIVFFRTMHLFSEYDSINLKINGPGKWMWDSFLENPIICHSFSRCSLNGSG